MCICLSTSADPSYRLAEGLTPDEEDEQHGVGEEGGEVDDLPGALHALGQTRAHDNPRQRQAAHQLPPEAAHVVPGAPRDAQHPVPAM